MTHARSRVVVAAALVVVAACSKADTTPAPAATADAGRPDETAPAPAAPTPAAPAPAAPAPSVAIRSVTACGDKPLPPCPLYAWMKANAAPAMAAQDFVAMTAALDKVAELAPDGYTYWASIARDGSSAGRVQNRDGVRAACRGCHNQYKDKYKREMRGKII